MTEYSLRRDDDDDICFGLEAKDKDDAIVRMKQFMRSFTPERQAGDWTLSLVERVEYPELNDILDSIGPFHLIFVHQCALEEDGTIIDEEVDIDIE